MRGARKSLRSEVELLLADTDEKTLDATLEDIRPRLIDRQTKEEYKESIDSIFRTRSKGKLLILGEAGAGEDDISRRVGARACMADGFWRG